MENKKFLINGKYIIEGDLRTAEKWLLENHPEEYFGGSISQIQDDRKPVQNGDFMLIAVLDYYKEELEMNDPDEIIEYIKKKKFAKELHYKQSLSSGDFEKNKAANEEFFNELKRIRENSKVVNSEWSGDYYVTTYSIDGSTIQYWENMELGIPSSIKYL